MIIDLTEYRKKTIPISETAFEPSLVYAPACWTVIKTEGATTWYSVQPLSVSYTTNGADDVIWTSYTKV